MQLDCKSALGASERGFDATYIDGSPSYFSNIQHHRSPRRRTRLLASLFMGWPVLRLTLLAAVTDFLALCTQFDYLALPKLALCLSAALSSTPIYIEVPWRSIIFVAPQCLLELHFTRTSEARIKQRKGIFWRNANLGISIFEKGHILRIDRGSDAHCQSGFQELVKHRCRSSRDALLRKTKRNSFPKNRCLGFILIYFS